MSVSITATYSTLSANGVATAFPFTFRAMAADEVAVMAYDEEGRDAAYPSFEVALSGGGGGVGGTGGTVTFSSPPADGLTIIIYSNPSFLQSVEFDQGSRWIAGAVNEVNDRAAVRELALRRDVSRAVSMPLGEPGVVLPKLASMDGQFLKVVDGEIVGREVATGTGGGYGGVRPEDMSSWDPLDATAAIRQALATGENVFLTPDRSYVFTDDIEVSGQSQTLSGSGLLIPQGDCGIIVPDEVYGVKLRDLTFDAPDHTGTLFKIYGDRTVVENIRVENAYSLMHVEGANTTTVRGFYARMRGKGFTWFGAEDNRTDVFHLSEVSLGFYDYESDEFAFDWDGFAHTLTMVGFRAVGGAGMIIRKTEGSDVLKVPTIGRLYECALDYSSAYGFDIQRVVDLDIVAPYVVNAAQDGIRIGAQVDTAQVRVSGGKSIASLSGYGIRNLGGPCYVINTDLFDNSLGTISGAVYSNAPGRLTVGGVDDGFYLDTTDDGPEINYAPNNYRQFDLGEQRERFFADSEEVYSAGPEGVNFSKPVFLQGNATDPLGAVPKQQLDAASLAAKFQIGLFTAGPSTDIPTDAKIVLTTGYATEGVGAETYAYDAAVDATYVSNNPRTAFLSSNGRGFRLAPLSGMPLATAFGATVTASNPSAPVQAENSAAIQAAMYWGPFRLPVGTIWCDPTVTLYPWPLSGNGPSVITGAGSAGNTGSFSRLAANCDDTITRPFISIPECYVDGADNKLHLPDGSVAPSAVSVGTGRACEWSNFKISTFYGRYATCVFLHNNVGSTFRNIQFVSAHRGLFLGGGFSQQVINCSFSGLYHASSRTLSEIESEAEFPFSFGIHIPNHTTIDNGSFSGWGTAVSWHGACTVTGLRVEGNECGFDLGRNAFPVNTWNGTSFANHPPADGTFDSSTLESNRWGIIFDKVVGLSVQRCAATVSSTKAPLNRKAGASLIIKGGTTNRTRLDGLGSSVNLSNIDYQNVFSVGYPEIIGSAITSRFHGSASAWSRSSPWRMVSSPFDYNIQAALAEGKQTISCDSQQVVVGLTSFDGSAAPVFSKRLGGVQVPVTTGATTHSVSFSNGVTTAQAAMTSIAAVTDGSSMLDAGEYWYASSIVGRRGHTGVRWVPMDETSPGTDAEYLKVTVAAGERVDISFFSFGTAANYTRRLYRGRKSGYFDGYWEIPASTLSYSDLGPAPTLKGNPPPFGVQILSAYEDDANYGLHITTSWLTTVAVTSRSTSGFSLSFGTAAPSGASFDWIMYRAKL